MKISSISNFRPSFGHISKQTIDEVRRHGEGYFGYNSSYSADTKFNMMDASELKRLENLVMRASKLDNSWIHYVPREGLIVKFYKDCEPSREYFFDSKKDGDTKASLDVLEGAVNMAETAESVEADENKELTGIWDREAYKIGNVYYQPDRFKSPEDNKILKRIYDYTFSIIPKANRNIEFRY